MHYAQQSQTIRQHLVKDQVPTEFAHAPGPGLRHAEVRSHPTQARHLRQRVHAGFESFDEMQGSGRIVRTDAAHDVQNVARDELALLNGEFHFRR